VRASTRPFIAITLYLSKRKEFNVGLYNVSALSLRFTYVECVEIMAVYYLAKYRYFLIRLGLVWPASIVKFRRFGDGPFDRAYLSSTRAEAATQPLGPRKSATECALSSERLGPSKVARVKATSRFISEITHFEIIHSRIYKKKYNIKFICTSHVQCCNIT